MNEPIKFYSDYVCIDCGKKYGKPRGGMTTSHTDICGICRKKKSLCHQRNYGWFLTEKNGFIFGGKKKMTEAQKKALDEIEGQLYAINARNISMRWIGFRKTPTMEEISELNRLLGFIILEIRTLKKTGKLNVDELHARHFGIGGEK